MSTAPPPRIVKFRPTTRPRVAKPQDGYPDPAESWSRRRPIRDGHRPGLVQSRADEYEFRPLREQRLSGPKRSRAHVEPVFVDEVVPDEGLGGSNASVE